MPGGRALVTTWQRLLLHQGPVSSAPRTATAFVSPVTYSSTHTQQPSLFHKNMAPSMLYQEIRREWSPICVLPAHEKKQRSKTLLSVALAVTGAFNAGINWKNCNARVSCIPLSRSIFPQISCNKWILCLQCCCSSITMSVIITPLQNKQKKLISRKIYGEWNTFRLDWGESNQITDVCSNKNIFLQQDPIKIQA